tara:strand:- start:63 stop:242 length:180 start_codon:yes stop_codon:yes gene_type:complete
MKRTKSHFKDPNRRSNRFKPTWVKRSELVKERNKLVKDLSKQGHNEFFCFVRSLEIQAK